MSVLNELKRELEGLLPPLSVIVRGGEEVIQYEFATNYYRRVNGQAD